MESHGTPSSEFPDETTASTPALPTLLPMPKEGEIFELTFDNRPEDQPIEMVRGDIHRYNKPDQWQYFGQKLTGVQTRRFKRVRVGDCRNLAEVLRKLEKYGKPAHGQFRNAFKRTFVSDETFTGFPDASWMGWYGVDNFPFVRRGGSSDFRRAGDKQYGDWLWVVEVESKTGN